MPAPKVNYSVQVLGGTDEAPTSRIVYEGASQQFARHDMGTARTAAFLSGGTVLIMLRENGRPIYRINVSARQVLETDLKGGAQ